MAATGSSGPPEHVESVDLANSGDGVLGGIRTDAPATRPAEVAGRRVLQSRPMWSSWLRRWRNSIMDAVGEYGMRGTVGLDRSAERQKD